MKLLNEIKNELVKYESEKLSNCECIDDKLRNFEIIENKLLFENDDNKFEIIINEDEVDVNYICKSNGSVSKFNYELFENKINGCKIDEWIVCLYNDLYDICEYDEDDDF